MVLFFYVGGGPWSIVISVAVSLLSALFHYSSLDDGSDSASWEEDHSYRRDRPPPRHPRHRPPRHRSSQGGNRMVAERSIALSLAGMIAVAVIIGLVVYGCILLAHPELARDRASRQLLRVARAAQRGLVRLRDALGWELQFQWGDAPDANGGRRSRRQRARQGEVSSLPVERFICKEELLRWSPTRLKDELRRLHISADMQLGRYSGGTEARSTHHFLRAGGVVEKSELVEAVMKARGGESGLSCAVCIAAYSSCEEIRVLPCGHRFHCECVDKWLVSQSKTCPLCSKPI